MRITGGVDKCFFTKEEKRKGGSFAEQVTVELLLSIVTTQNHKSAISPTNALI